MVAFDLETTGVDPETARIVTASVVSIVGGTPRVQSWLADPGVEIPAEASRVHGITTEHARAHGSPAAKVALGIYLALTQAVLQGTPIVIYNAAYDLTVLDRELRRHTGKPGGALDAAFVVDPLVLDRAADKFRRGSRKLTDVCRHYGVSLSDEDAHTSAGDAVAAARLAWKIAHRYPAIGCLTLAELMERQATAHSAWAVNFEEYLARQGKPERISRDWPVREFVAEQVA
jgi:DNA polymerase-3 subunit epsilon